MAFLAPLAGVSMGAATATATGLGVGGLMAGLAGTGIAVWGQMQAGQAQAQAAAFNAAQLQQQALSAQYQAAQQAQEARIAAQMQGAQAALLEAQQKNLKFEAEGVRASAAENIRRRRTEGSAELAAQRAAYAAAGVTTAGTPLAVLSESAGRLELDLLDTQYEAENVARDLQFQAAGLGVDIATSRYNARAQSRLASWLPKVGRYQRQSLLAEAAWTRKTGAIARGAANIGAAATLLQGAGNFASGAYALKTR